MKQLFFLIMIFTTINLAAKDFNPPATPQKAITDNVHGFMITDPYRWLEDKDNPETRKWSEDQHNYTLNYIETNTSEISGLRDEIRNYIDRDYRSSPKLVADREFFYARKKGEQQNKFYTVIDGKEKLLFDPIEYDPTGKSAIKDVSYTKKAEKAAVGLEFQGNEIITYRIIDTKTGKVLGKPIEGLRGFSWTKDEKHAYITVRTKEMIDNQEPLRTYLHKIGDDRKNDKFIIAPEDAKDMAYIWDDKYENYTFTHEGDFYSNTLKMKETGSDDDFILLYSSKKNRVSPKIDNGKIYYFSNDNAPNFKIMAADLDNPAYENAVEFYPEKETVLEDYVITSDYFIVQDKKDVMSRLFAYDKEGNIVRQLELPVLGKVMGLSYHKESNQVLVAFSTFTAPTTIYKLDGKSLEWEFFYQDDPPIKMDNIESKLVFYKSKDGTKVPMFLVYKKGTTLDGNNPAMLYGYGGFNISMYPHYLGTTSSFVKRGGVYAIAAIRGGAEYGEAWHEAGMLGSKQNVFDDFIAAGEYLIDEGYTNPDKLAIKGGSNGGLLVGAVMVQRPDLFKTVVCAVPLLDMVRYHKFLIARYWIPEYGDPDIKEDFMFIKEYSPYHNINTVYNYPSVLVKAGENDTRVDPLHAKKFAAMLQNSPGMKNEALLFIDFESGHGSGKSTEQKISDIEYEWRFVMDKLGMK
ncbi:MAG: prolyl oligopeptidase family serine peptidase [Candidatus Kapaibacterium sp.]